MSVTSIINLFKISIPYGSIKSVLMRSTQTSLTIFQFLMVRLKVNTNIFSLCGVEFQFLMVRLKVSYRNERMISPSFQFLMVRLKDFSGKLKNPVPDFSPRNNIWKYTTSFNGVKGHPAVFPESLANDHIISWSNEGDIVYDPFMGSGTTGKMAVLNGRNFIGIELDDKYFDIAKRRISEVRNKAQVRWRFDR